MENNQKLVSRFGYEWHKYNDILPIYEEQFLRWSSLISKEEWQDKEVLDVGCGMGRNSYWPLTYKAKHVTAIDLDDRSIASSRHTLKNFSNCTIQKMSAYEITYENQFDITFSIGVIHHLDNYKLALKNMYQATKPGGKMLIWVYGKENMNGFVKLLNPFRKYIFSKLPIPVTHFLSLFPTMILFALLKANFGKIEYFNLIRKFSFNHLRSIIFDQMLPNTANYWTKEEVLHLMKECQLHDIHIQSVNNMSWCCVGTK